MWRALSKKIHIAVQRGELTSTCLPHSIPFAGNCWEWPIAGSRFPWGFLVKRVEFDKTSRCCKICTKKTHDDMIAITIHFAVLVWRESSIEKWWLQDLNFLPAFCHSRAHRHTDTSNTDDSNLACRLSGSNDQWQIFFFNQKHLLSHQVIPPDGSCFWLTTLSVCVRAC